MLRTARLKPGRRAVVPHPVLPTNTTPTTITARPVTFATGKSNITRPLTFTGTRGGTTKPNPSSPQRFFARPPSAWSPSTYVSSPSSATPSHPPHQPTNSTHTYKERHH